MIKQTFSLALTAVLLAGCVTTRTNDDGSVNARLGQTVNAGGLKVTPLQVLEDSRCPIEAKCIWAGRVRLSVRVASGAGSSIQELSTDKPLQVAVGHLVLQGVMPPRSTQRTLALSDYRFTFKFSRGI